MPAGPQPAGAPPARRLAVERIRLRRDFLAANAGIRVPSEAFVLLVRPCGHAAPRSGFTVTKKIGNAVQRNRARRRLKEAARLAMATDALPGADHVFIARPRPVEQPFEALVTDMRRALAKARRRLDAQG